MEHISTIQLHKSGVTKQRSADNLRVLTLIDEEHNQPDIGMLLPERDYNRCLLDQVSTPSNGTNTRELKGAFVGLFLSDPFLNLATTISQLKAVGVKGVANFPSTSFYGDDFAKQLDGVGFSRKLEFERLAEVQDLGLQALGCLNAETANETLNDLGGCPNISLWLIHSGLECLFRSSVSPVRHLDAPSEIGGDVFFYDPDITAESVPASYSGYARASWWDSLTP